MKFSCDRCQRRFSLAEEPVPGRVYRVPCRCGHTIVLLVQPGAAGALRWSRDPVRAPASRTALPSLPARSPPRGSPAPPAPAAPGLERTDPTVPPPAAAAYDPYARARALADELVVRASQRPTPASAAFPAAKLRRVRTRAFALGVAAGAVLSALAVGASSTFAPRFAPPPAPIAPPQAFEPRDPAAALETVAPVVSPGPAPTLATTAAAAEPKRASASQPPPRPGRAPASARGRRATAASAASRARAAPPLPRPDQAVVPTPIATDAPEGAAPSAAPDSRAPALDDAGRDERPPLEPAVKSAEAAAGAHDGLPSEVPSGADAPSSAAPAQAPTP